MEHRNPDPDAPNNHITQYVNLASPLFGSLPLLFIDFLTRSFFAFSRTSENSTKPGST